MRIFLAASAIFGMAGQSIGQPRPVVIEIPRQFADCVVKMREAYVSDARTKKRKTIKIVPRLCPKVAPTEEELSASVRNTGGVPISDGSAQIIIGADKAGCFFAQLQRANRSATRYGGIVKVDMARCER